MTQDGDYRPRRCARWMLALLPAWLVGLAGCQWLQQSGPGRPVQVVDLGEASQVQLAAAESARSAGDYETALAMFREVLAENPTVTTAHIGIGHIYLEMEDYAQAEPAFARAARLEPQNFDAQIGHGTALQMLERFVEAIRAYHRALTINPESVKANLNLATTYLQMKEYQSALLFAEKAVALDPSSGNARANLGTAYENLGRNQDAIDEYIAAIELLDEDSPPLLMNLINVLAREKRYQEAVNTAENLVRLEPSANAYERLGWGYFRLNRFERSIEAYRAAVEIDPDHWPSLNGIGVNALNTWLLSGKIDEAARREARNAFRRSLRVHSDQPKVIMLMTNYGF